MSTTVLFIHGAWLTPASWDLFRARFEARGYPGLAPAWPLMDRPVDALRDAPHPDLAQLTIGRIVDHYAGLVRALAQPPILVGHGFGGLVVQLLLDRGFGAAGVAIDPVPPRGVLPDRVAFRSALRVLTTWAGWRRVLHMSAAQFAANLAQGLPAGERDAAYARHVVPAPGRICFQAAFGIGTGVNWRNPARAPLLLVAGERDRMIGPSLVRAAYQRHSRSPAVTAFKAFPGRSHFLIGEPAWEEVADYVLDWACARVRAAA